MNVKLQSVDKFTGNIGHCKRRCIAKSSTRVVGLQAIHLHARGINRQTVGNARRQVGEKLRRRCEIVDDEVVVEAELEADLDQSSIHCFGREAIRILDDSRKIGSGSR